MRKPTFQVTRRQAIRGLLATGAFGLTVKLSGCSTSPTAAGGSDTLTAGFIYVGPKDDYGYNQAHAEGRASLDALDGVKTSEEASVPETNAVQETIRSMIDLDGATAIFATSFGYFDPHVLALAKDFPEVQFFHCGGLYQEGVHPENVGSYFGYIDEAQYVAGVVAAHASNSKRLGFIGAKPIPQVLRNINSFTLGARSIDPSVTTQVIFTGDWADPVREAEAANSMADQGIDVLTCHVDSPKVVMETAERRGIFATGYHANQSELAPQGYLTGAEWDWSNVYKNYISLLQQGKTLMNGGIPHLVRGGFKDGFLKLSPFGPAVSASAQQAAEAAQAQLVSGELVIYKGEIKDNQGKTIIAGGKELGQTAIELEQMNWLAEGVMGSVG
ncbi:BMP family ABC transporter substrate-binding protein [Phormidium tenue]|uniref:BMP family ABC transporter substrate-binding protein n=1 Tax=Phormidium tenue NIES-30 TaxID=549789 RepID=A0A1U7J3J9_9CYAN|nr:BMP family ABC transporter substrate-binding protein [Phormidium tenue]MBD2233405.1 BMP family ABC transporter substrate-binding protein [Phormidium tenue FACHB-1052]OKH46860.1 BMP family ABC transporter substrate-binding protein [Phormidium tenue NIES-30]